ncbi:MAG: hypothetical protein KKF41_01565 [Actinobacteria bacterium]|nr:hypothetical protein [Actinomycetota bacterium]MBU1942169.1 hypothetical protein [Actinomycetota bacterium]MBU2686253.1 hypothetical protein [Actinomycetota bacterium]
MKFSLLLFLIGAKLRLTGLASGEFRKLLRRERFILVIGTADGSRARTFRVGNGWARSRRGADPRADTELVWCDPETAACIMLSKNELDVYSAIGSSKLRILGNFKYAMWFMRLAG